MVKVFAELGREFTEAYEQLMELCSVVGPLRRIVYIMNLPTDLEKRMNAMRYNLQETNRRREDCHSTQIDKLPIVIESDLLYEYDIGVDAYAAVSCTAGKTGIPYSLCVDGVLEIPQGSLVSITGIHGAGKVTLNKMLGGLLYPNQGHVYSPAHLHTVHVSQQVVVLETSLWSNLTFGRPHVREQRVRQILSRMRPYHSCDMEGHLEKELVAEGYVLPNDESASWLRSLSTGSRAAVHYARAFVANPEILVLNRPTSHFYPPAAQNLLKLMRDHINDRGLDVHEHKRTRRPRTVIFSAYRDEFVQVADIRLHIECKQTGDGIASTVSSAPIIDWTVSASASTTTKATSMTDDGIQASLTGV